jgi:hypothetical protein
MPNALYNIWAVTVGVSVTERPRSLRLQFLFVVFVFYCSAISTVFLTFLTSILVDPGYENQLTSLDEILDSGIGFGYQELYGVVFSVSSVLRHNEVSERAEICSTDWECFAKIRDTDNFAAFGSITVAREYTKSVHDHSSICILNDYDYDFSFITIYVQRGSIFLESLNKFITQSFESGMLDRALRNTIFLSWSIPNIAGGSDEYFVFTLSHLHIAFYILFFGHALSFLLFLCEVFYHFIHG